MTPFRSLAAAQTTPIRGDVAANLEEHARLARAAAQEGAQVVLFPELSPTGYELDLGDALAFSEVGAFAPEHCPGAAVPPREDSVFQPGAHNPLVRFGDQSGAVSICTDSLHRSHPQRAAELGAKTYFSSQFAIPLHVEPKLTLLKKQAVRFGMTIVFSNFGGPTGGLASGGGSGIWSAQAECVAQLGASGSGLAIGIQDGAGWRGKTLSF